MSSIDVESLLVAISDDAPCGEDLAYDPAYVELEGMVQGKPEQVMGDQVIAAEEPNWRQIRDRCLELNKRTRDLRVTTYLSAALLQIDGLSGLRDGLKLLNGVLVQYWDQVFPLLDAEDNNDPTERVNIIDALAKPPHTTGDSMRFQQRLREIPLCSSKQMGRFSLRDIAVASGEAKPSNENDAAPTQAGIEAAFMDTDLEVLQADAAAIVEIVDLVKQIEGGLTERIGAGNAPNLSSFVALAQEVNKALGQYLTKRGVNVESAEDGDGEQEQAASGGGPAITGEIRSREDVIRILDKAINYYQQQEPSSPVPLLLGRAKRLVTKNFVDIIQDLTPDSMAQITVISGLDSEANSG